MALKLDSRDASLRGGYLSALRPGSASRSQWCLESSVKSQTVSRPTSALRPVLDSMLA